MSAGPIRYKKPLKFAPGVEKAIRSMPEGVRDAFGFALMRAQYGDRPPGSRQFGEGVSADVLKLVEDDGGDTYRAAYVVAFPGIVYLLDVFQKKSKRGTATPREDIERVKARYEAARLDYNRHKAAYAAAAAAAAGQASTRAVARLEQRSKPGAAPARNRDDG